MFKKKVFAYENSYGDKGIIIARSYRKAKKIYCEEYLCRKIVDDDNEDDIDDAYFNDGVYLFKVAKVRNNKLYNTFPY